MEEAYENVLKGGDRRVIWRWGQGIRTLRSE